MADGKTNTIIIRDETGGRASGTSSNSKALQYQDGELVLAKPKAKASGTGRSYKLGQKRGGVEFNRLERLATKPLSKMTGGMYERDLRYFKATKGLFLGGSIVGYTLITSALSTMMIQEWQKYLGDVQVQNQKDNLRRRTGNAAFSRDYSISTNFITGRVHYKNNN